MKDFRSTGSVSDLTSAIMFAEKRCGKADRDALNYSYAIMIKRRGEAMSPEQTSQLPSIGCSSRLVSLGSLGIAHSIHCS